MWQLVDALGALLGPRWPDWLDWALDRLADCLPWLH